jgi:two-component system chemotaxis response regulator CheB
MNEPKFIIVAGASAGGMSALTELVSQFDSDMEAAVFIVMHLSGTAISDYLVNQLQPHTAMKCSRAEDGERIKKGHIYIAHANHHLLIKKGKILLGHGPTENRWRPSIDVLFRSAAAAYSTRVIGIILTGLLNDGAAGMTAVKNSGGITIVQDPNEAEYPGMPLSVLNATQVDFCIPLALMGETIMTILQTEPEDKPAPPAVIIEAEIAEKVAIDYDRIKKLGDMSLYACPDCGGSLWNIKEEKVNRYRCHIGHAYTEKDLEIKQEETAEASLWIASRIMEERRNLLNKMERDHLEKGLVKSASNYRQKAEEIGVHIGKLKDILFASQSNTEK